MSKPKPSCSLPKSFAIASVGTYLWKTAESAIPIKNHDTDPNIFLRLVKNILRNIKATGLWFLIGIALSAIFQRYVPAQAMAKLFGKEHEGFGLLMAATIGVPLYVCGGGTIPLIIQWLADGMSYGSAAAFMITGPATKITQSHYLGLS